MPSILFICTENRFRSPLAAALLSEAIQKEKVEGSWRVESAGTWTKAGQPVAKAALEAAKRLGLKGLEAHVSREVDQELLNQFDLILVMEIGHQVAMEIEFPTIFGRLMLLSEIVDGMPYNIPDPSHQNDNPEEIVLELQRLIQRGRKKILSMAENLHKARQLQDKSDS